MNQGRRARPPLRFNWLAPSAILLVLLYPTVWLHELGHAAAAYGLGCKSDPFSTGMELGLFGSTGGEIDYTCLAEKGSNAYAVVGVAGIVVNIVAAWVAYVVSRQARRPGWKSGWLLFCLANALEAFSYLTGSTLFPRSDMLEVLPVIPVPPVLIAAVATALGLPLIVTLHRSIAKKSNTHQSLSLVALSLTSATIVVCMVWARLSYVLIAQAG